MVTLSTYVKIEQGNKNLIINDKHKPQAKVTVLNWHNENPNIITVEMLTVLLQ